MKICVSDYKDLNAIAKVHQLAFPNHLSSALGRAFIEKTLTWYLQNPKNGFLLHLEDNGRIIGYVTGFYNDGTLKYGSATTIGQFAFKVALFSFVKRPWLLFHHEIRKKWKLLFKQFYVKISSFQKKKTKSNSILTVINVVSSKFCGLLSIGVDPSAQQKGFGSILIQAFEKTAFEKFKVNQFKLSVRSDNMKARNSYLRNGWVLNFQKDGNCEMVKSI